MKSLSNVEYKALVKQEDFVKAIPSNGFTVSETEPITDDTFYFEQGSKIVHVKTTSTKRGFFNLIFEKLKVGDIIEIECDFYSSSGVKPKIYIDEILNILTPNTSVTVNSKQSTSGQWETLKLSHIVTNLVYSGDFRVSFGLATSDVGEFYMRDARAKVTSKSRNNPTLPIVKKYTIRKNAEGNWEIRKDSFLSDNGTLTVKDSTTLLLRYDIPYDLPTTRRSPVVLVSGDFVYNSYKYRPTSGNSLSTQVELKLLNSSGVAVDLATIENLTHFSVIAFG